LLPAPAVRQLLLLRCHIPAIQDERDRWRAEARLGEFLHRFSLDDDLAPEAASGGQVKRAALALAFALEPDLLLLDEPTNHLDIDGITQLESTLLKQPAAIVVTHDRAFLDRVATRILELDWSGSAPTRKLRTTSGSGRRARRRSRRNVASTVSRPGGSMDPPGHEARRTATKAASNGSSACARSASPVADA
jgi:ATPase subunit of ABC transporter with duplicated ATPase domains